MGAIIRDNNIKNKKQNYHLFQQFCLYSKELTAWSRRDICVCRCVAALFPTAKTWWQLKYPPVDEWVNRLWSSIHIHKRIFILRNLDALCNVDEAWGRYASHKKKNAFTLNEVLAGGKIVETEGRVVVARGSEDVEWKGDV